MHKTTYEILSSQNNLHEGSQPQKNPLHLLVFELSVGGHYPEYISHIINYWCDRSLAGRLSIVVVPEFLLRHSDVVEIVSSKGENRVEFVPLTARERAHLKPYGSSIDRNIRAWQEFALIGKYAKTLKADRIFLPYIDTRMLPLALGKSLPCAFSGIYFRPSFHYPSFSSFNNRLSWQEKLKHLKEKVILYRVLRIKKLKTLYSLDPFAVESIDRLAKLPKAKAIADPVKVHQNTSVDLVALKSQLGIEASRQVHLLFGDLNQRKGIEQVLTAIASLPTKLTSKVCLLLVGSMPEDNYAKFQEQKQQLVGSQPIQIIHYNQYIPEADIQNYFLIADAILALYQRHIGMSGILNRAAVAGKPVLSSDYGLMGEITRRYQLGLAVDSEDPEAIAKGLTKFLQQAPKQYCDRELMALFARQNSVANFTKTIFQDL